jgi:hypothetical protein
LLLLVSPLVAFGQDVTPGSRRLDLPPFQPEDREPGTTLPPLQLPEEREPEPLEAPEERAPVRAIEVWGARLLSADRIREIVAPAPDGLRFAAGDSRGKEAAALLLPEAANSAAAPPRASR